MPAPRKKTVKKTKKISASKTKVKKTSTKKAPARKKPAVSKKSKVNKPVRRTGAPVVHELILIEDPLTISETTDRLEIPLLSTEPNLGIAGLETDTGIVSGEGIDGITDKISGIMDVDSTDETLPSLQVLMDGGFNISRQVLARIASLAAAEITGLAPQKRNPLNRFVDQIRGRTDGIKVDVGTTEAAVDMNIRVQYGTQIPDISNRLREVIARRIHEMTGLNVVEVNIRVQDVTPPAPPAV